MTVRINNLTKRYGGTLALDDVSLEIQSGTIHALLGHNGAGKSTVIRCLGGGTAPTSGTIDVDGVRHEHFDPRQSIASGIAVIYQHLSLIEGLTVAENLFLGQELKAGGFIARRRQRDRARAALARVGSTAAPDVLVRELSIGQRQLVEIAKALERDAKLLILDEPTAALSVDEAERLGELLLGLRAEGMAILYVTHLLAEVDRLADHVSVLRNGRTVFASPWTRDSERDVLVSVISDDSDRLAERPRSVDRSAPPRLQLRSFSTPGLDPIDLDVRAGEVVALYGLIGAGRTRLLNGVFGRAGRAEGAVLVDGESVDPASPAAALAAGIALVPGDRLREGLFLSLPAIENVLIDGMAKVTRLGFRSRTRERVVFDQIAGLLSVRPDAPTLAAGRFSGGNQQKLLLARWVHHLSGVRVLLLDDPTQGVDIGARHEIYHVVSELAERLGLAVLVATNEPDEVVALAHRCLIMQQGQLVAELDMSTCTPDALLRAIHTPSSSTI